jgi:hypothetical protein
MSELECSVCLEKFTPDGPKMPRICIPCGHSFCNTCIEEISNTSKAACPTCKTYMLIDKSTNKPKCPVNYSLVTVIQALDQKFLVKSNPEMDLDNNKNTEHILASLKSERNRLVNEQSELQSQILQLEQIVHIEKSKLHHLNKALQDIDFNITKIEFSKNVDISVSNSIENLSCIKKNHNPLKDSKDPLIVSESKNNFSYTLPFDLSNQKNDFIPINNQNYTNNNQMLMNNQSNFDPFKPLDYDPFQSSGQAINTLTNSYNNTKSVSKKDYPHDDPFELFN